MNLRLTYKTYITIKSIIWILYGIYVINAFISLESFDLKMAILLCGVAIEFTLMSFLDHWYRFKQPYLLDWFRLVTFFSIILNFMFLVEILDKNQSLLVHNAVMVQSTEALPSIIVVLVGLIGLKLSEVLVIRTKKNRSPVYKSAGTVKNILSFTNKNLFFGFTIALSFIQFYLLLQGVVGYGSEGDQLVGTYSFLLQAIHILGPLVLVSYAILLFRYNYKDKLFILIFTVYFLLQITSGFISGMKQAIITPIIIILIPYLLGGHRIPKKLVVGTVIFVIFLYPINNNYRDVLNSPVQTSKVSAFLLAIENTLDNGFFDNIKTGSESYQDRVSLFPILMYSVENEQQWMDYKYMNRYLYLPIAWVLPRFLLNSKPMADTGSKLYYLTTGRYDTSITPTTYGWAYFEGGYIPVLISFFLFGIFITILQSKFSKNNFLHLLLYTSLLISFLKVESDIYFLVSGLLQKLLIGVVFYYLFFKYKPKKFVSHSTAI